MTTKITVTPITLCDLLGGHFTLEACEALCEHFEDVGSPDFAPMVGDIAISYNEIPANWVEESDDVIAELANGNCLIAL